MNASQIWTAYYTIVLREVLRFSRIWLQTIIPPVITTALYFVIFGNLIGSQIGNMDGHTYMEFIVPGLIMMSVLQNAFANSSSSLIQSKIMGNLIFLLLTPLSHWGWFGAYLFSSILRGVVVGAGVLAVAAFFVPLSFAAPWWVLIFAFLGAGLLASLGVVAGLWAEKFDQMATFQNFIIVPMTFLSGVFYSLHSLPPLWLHISRFNPFFYLIDGFRFGFFGQSDVSPFMSLAVASAAFVLVASLAVYLLKIGYKIRH